MAKRTSRRKPAARRRKTGDAKEAARQPAPGRPRHVCPIVGMGASAGGLEAFEKFLSRMPPQSGLAFVLVPHLDARHKSAMTELLQRYTSMPVVEIADRMTVAPNRVHIIPPNGTLAIERGVLRVQTPRGPGNTIDAFFRSLAEDQEENAIGIILSGSGSDGTVGIKAIKEHGGLTVAQASLSSRFDSMPHSAVATGLVDLVLPVEDMPEKLVEYARYLGEIRERPGVEALREDGRKHLVKIYTLLRTKTGHDFSRYKDSTFVRRVQRRMQVLQIAAVTDYIELLRKDVREVELLFRDLLIGVTHFFRDQAAFAALAKDVIPALVAGKGADDQIRVWVPGCATGEEAYSLAILLREQLAGADARPKVQIFATDIDDQALETARTGRYSEASARDVSAERLERFFVKDGNYYRVAKDIREMCIFSMHNLIKDAPFSKLDLISCRNLLIYLDGSLQGRIIPLFHFALRHGGYLFLGPSENVTQHVKLFTRIDGRHRIFKARPVGVDRPAIDFPLTTAASYRGQGGEKGTTLAAIEESVSRRALRLVDSYAPAYLIVDDRYEVLHFSGRTGKYLQPSAGAASLDLFSLIDTGLRPDVRNALHKAMASGQKVVQENVFVNINGGRQALNIIAEPIAGNEGGNRFFVLLFQDTGPVKPREAAAEPRGGTDAQKDETIAHLEAELLNTRERLQTMVEELETSNEEMKASNEEFQSVNEELQSSNEELETSKEELQSVNEELETVNAELNSKVDGLERAMNDRKNLLESTQIATVFLDNALRIKSFTPAMTDMFHLIEGDLGRPITDIVTKLDYGELGRDVHKVLRTLSRIEHEVTIAGRDTLYMMRILPYRTIDNVIDGVVITFIDITERKRGEEDRARLATIVSTSYDAIVGLTLDGTIASWNAGAERLYGYAAAEAVGQRWAMLAAVDRAGEARSVIDRLKRAREPSTTETQRIAKGGRMVQVASTVSPVLNAAGKVIGLSAIERDVTERKQAEERRRLLLAELNHRVKNTLATVLSISAQTLRHSRSVESFHGAFEGRVQALAKTHDVLASADWTGADLKDVVIAELAPYREQGDHLSLKGEPLMLAPNAALMLGMVFHELATNAAKHGAFTVDSGHVEVTWARAGRGQRLTIEWSERDGPKAERPHQNGFGLTLIERGVAHELQGRATIDFANGGLRCVLDVPLAELQALPG
ncbi:MAG TPA: chemotaxis protein CheB [Stellaceae bacterium]|nr:chemotaxis protein CheB [Stellaceae bacterium]